MSEHHSSSSSPRPGSARPAEESATPRRIRVLLADDHQLVRDVLSERLSREADILVVAKASDAEEALLMARSYQPDILLMDIDMPGLICFDAAERIMSLRPEVRIVFLSAFFNDRYIAEALRIKARGYVTKRESPERVVEAVREVAAGGVYFSDDVRQRMVVSSEGVALPPDSKTRASTLTPRELEVLKYIARGMSKKEIATVMSISVKTIENHCGSIMVKLGIHDRVGLTLYAIREGLAEP
jgi:two-component system response regulator DegU